MKTLNNTSESSGVAIYEIKSNSIPMNQDLKNNPIGKLMSTYLEKLSVDKSELLIEVKFDNGRSHSQLIDPGFKNSDLVNNMSTALALAKDAGSYIYNWSSGNIINKKEKENQLESNSNELKWHITEESKMIKGYACKKAVIYAPKSNHSENNAIETIAWFTSEVPLPIGPNEHLGLPGMTSESSELLPPVIGIEYSSYLGL